MSRFLRARSKTCTVRSEAASSALQALGRGSVSSAVPAGDPAFDGARNGAGAGAGGDPGAGEWERLLAGPARKEIRGLTCCQGGTNASNTIKHTNTSGIGFTRLLGSGPRLWLLEASRRRRFGDGEGTYAVSLKPRACRPHSLEEKTRTRSEHD